MTDVDPAGIVTLVTLLPPDVAWNVSDPLVLAGVTVTPPVNAGSLTVTVNAVDSIPITPVVGPESVAAVGGAAALYVIGDPL